MSLPAAVLSEHRLPGTELDERDAQFSHPALGSAHSLHGHRLQEVDDDLSFSSAVQSSAALSAPIGTAIPVSSTASVYSSTAVLTAPVSVLPVSTAPLSVLPTSISSTPTTSVHSSTDPVVVSTAPMSVLPMSISSPPTTCMATISDHMDTTSTSRSGPVLATVLSTPAAPKSLDDFWKLSASPPVPTVRETVSSLEATVAVSTTVTGAMAGSMAGEGEGGVSGGEEMVLWRNVSEDGEHLGGESEAVQGKSVKEKKGSIASEEGERLGEDQRVVGRFVNEEGGDVGEKEKVATVEEEGKSQGEGETAVEGATGEGEEGGKVESREEDVDPQMLKYMELVGQRRSGEDENLTRHVSASHSQHSQVCPLYMYPLPSQHSHR